MGNKTFIKRIYEAIPGALVTAALTAFGVLVTMYITIAAINSRVSALENSQNNFVRKDVQSERDRRIEQKIDLILVKNKIVIPSVEYQ